MNRIRKFLQLSRPDKFLLTQAIFVLATVSLGLRTLPWLTLQRYLLKLTNQRSGSPGDKRPSTERIAWAIRTASMYIPKATCLPQALAGQFLLIQNAYPADLQIGVTKNNDGKLEAHAWVTSKNDVIVGEKGNPDRFVPLSPLDIQGMEGNGRTF